MQKRLYKFSELTQLGGCLEWWRQWRMSDPNFPKPSHGKMYDIKVIEAFLDNLSGIQQKSIKPDWDKVLAERFARRGNVQNENTVPR